MQTGCYNKLVQNKSLLFWTNHLADQEAGPPMGFGGPLKKLSNSQEVNLWRRLDSPTTSATSAAPAGSRGRRLPDPTLPGVSSSLGSSRAGLRRGSLTRSPALVMVGDRCMLSNIMEEGVELFSSEGNSPFKEVGWDEINCKLLRCPVSAVLDVSDLGGGLGQAPQDGLAAYERGQLSVEADAVLHIPLTRESPGQRLPSGHGIFQLSSTSCSPCEPDQQAV